MSDSNLAHEIIKLDEVIESLHTELARVTGQRECAKELLQKWESGVLIRLDESESRAKIREFIDKYERREKDPKRPPFEQEAYAFAAYDLKQLIKPEVND